VFFVGSETGKSNAYEHADEWESRHTLPPAENEQLETFRLENPETGAIVRP
jgi:hypothetical protein